MKVKSESEIAQSCPTFSDPMDCSLPGSSVHGIFQARVLEWGAIAFSAYKSKLLLFSVFCLFFNLCYLFFILHIGTSHYILRYDPSDDDDNLTWNEHLLGSGYY